MSFSLRHNRVRTIRDAVEIAAILLAGVWALYVFAYENGIKPGLTAPSISISANMRHVGNDGNLMVIRFDETIRNTGSVPVYFLGYSSTVLGSRVLPLATPGPATVTKTSNDLNGYYRYSKSQPVYRQAFVTPLGDPRAGSNIDLTPGEAIPLTSEFYVPKGRFDHLNAVIVTVFTKYADRTIPTKLIIEPSGWTRFDSIAPKGIEVEGYDETYAQLDLKAE